MGPVIISGKLSHKDCFSDSKTLKAEQPLILHPEIDHPENHFKFLRDGRIKGTSRRGDATIEVCGLNRKKLILARRKRVDKFLKDLFKLINKQLIKENKEIFRDFFYELLMEIVESQLSSKPFSRLWWFMLIDFDKFIIEQLTGVPEEYQILVKEYYEEFVEEFAFTSDS